MTDEKLDAALRTLEVARANLGRVDRAAVLLLVDLVDYLNEGGTLLENTKRIIAEKARQDTELAEWQAKCETRSRELEAAREEARRAEKARDEMQRELLEAQRDLADMKDAVAAAFGGHA